MTEQFAALAAIAQNPGPVRDEVLADFYNKWQHEFLLRVNAKRSIVNAMCKKYRQQKEFEEVEKMKKSIKTDNPMKKTVKLGDGQRLRKGEMETEVTAPNQSLMLMLMELSSMESLFLHRYTSNWQTKYTFPGPFLSEKE